MSVRGMIIRKNMNRKDGQQVSKLGFPASTYKTWERQLCEVQKHEGSSQQDPVY